MKKVFEDIEFENYNNKIIKKILLKIEFYFENNLDKLSAIEIVNKNKEIKKEINKFYKNIDNILKS